MNELKKIKPMKHISVRISEEQLKYLKKHKLNLSMVLRFSLAKFIDEHRLYKNGMPNYLED